MRPVMAILRVAMEMAGGVLVEVVGAAMVMIMVVVQLVV